MIASVQQWKIPFTNLRDLLKLAFLHGKAHVACKESGVDQQLSRLALRDLIKLSCMEKRTCHARKLAWTNN